MPVTSHRWRVDVVVGELDGDAVVLLQGTTDRSLAGFARRRATRHR